MSGRPVSDEIIEIMSSLVLFAGYTTADGNIGGTTLVCSELVSSNDFITNHVILLVSGNSKNETQVASTFNSISGTVTVAPAFSGQVLKGTQFYVLANSNLSASVISSILSIVTANQGAIYSGIVTGIPGANQFTIASLAGKGDGAFTSPIGNPYVALPFITAGRVRIAGVIAGGPFNIGEAISASVSGVTAVVRYQGAAWIEVDTIVGGAFVTTDVVTGATSHATIGAPVVITGARPQGEQQAVTNYMSNLGIFTTAAFSIAVGLGDTILLLNPDIASISWIANAINSIFASLSIGGDVDIGNNENIGVNHLIGQDQIIGRDQTIGRNQTIGNNVTIGGTETIGGDFIANGVSIPTSIQSLTNGVHVDSVLGAAGTAWPLGTAQKPVSNLTDAITIAAAFKTRVIFLHGSSTYTIPADLTQQYVFIGDSRATTVLAMNGHDMMGSVLYGLQVSGVNSGAASIVTMYCNINTSTFGGTSYGCHVMPGATLTTSTPALAARDMTFGTGAIISAVTIGTHIILNASGDLTIANETNAGTTVKVYGESLAITVAGSDTAGAILLEGTITQITNSTGGTVVNDYTNGGTIVANLNVPAANSPANVLERDVIGNKTDSAVTTVGTTASAEAYIKGLLNQVQTLISQGFEPVLPSEEEFWQDEFGFNEGIWDLPTNPATGTPWTKQSLVGGYREAAVAPNASENARLNGSNVWMIAPGLYGTNTIIRKVVLEFVVRFTTLANFDNTNFIMGLTPNKTDVRTSNNVIGFILTGAGNALETLTDNGGAETVNTGFGETLTNVNKFRIEVTSGTVKFLLNEVLIATHTTNLPNAVMYRNFYVANTAGGATNFEILGMRQWPEAIIHS